MDPKRQFTDQIDRTGVRNLRWKIVVGVDDGKKGLIRYRTLMDDGEPMAISQWSGRCDVMELMFAFSNGPRSRPPWIGIVFWAISDGKRRVRYVSNALGFAYLAIVTRPEADKRLFRIDDGIRCYRLGDRLDGRCEFVTHMTEKYLPLRNITWKDDVLSLTIDLDCYEDLECMTHRDYGYERLP